MQNPFFLDGPYRNRKDLVVPDEFEWVFFPFNAETAKALGDRGHLVFGHNVTRGLTIVSELVKSYSYRRRPTTSRKR